MFTTRAVILVSLLSLLALPAPLPAQDSATGSLAGTVFDPAGGRVAQAVVVLVNTGTASRYNVTTNAEAASPSPCFRPETTPRASKLKACHPK